MWGSTRLNPRPFIIFIYVNDMPGVVKNKLLLYADDSAIIVSGKNISDVKKALSNDLFFSKSVVN